MASKAEKSYVQFSGGINTEASPVNFPDGFSSDEENLILGIDGTRERRLGLDFEDNGISFTMASTVASGTATRTFKWENVGGNPNLNYVVVQVGTDLHIYQDKPNPTAFKNTTVISLIPYAATGASSDTLAQNPVDIAYGKGNIFVVGKYLEPIWIKYSEAASTFTVSYVNIRERDFEGIDDGITNLAQPTGAIATHTYNLYNRGWTEAQITSFVADQSKYPSKAMETWLGLQSTKDPLYADSDGVKAFSPAKLVSELFQDASAPTGNFIRNPFNTAFVPLSGTTNDHAITTWTISGTGATTQTVTVTTSGNHNLSIGNTATISGQTAYYRSDAGLGGGGGGGGFGIYLPTFSFNGDQTVVSVPTANTFTFTVTFPAGFVSWISQYATLGTVNTNLIGNPSGYTSTVRPKAVAFFAGRVWFAGTPHDRLSSKIFFSQIIESDAQYGKCYQQASPVDYRISDLVATDGGTIIIPELADVLDIVPMGSSLLVFASNGVWQIGPGDKEYFSATSYSIRKVSDFGAVSAASIVMADGTIPIYWGLSDIYAIVQDSTTGFFTAQNLTAATINTLYNEIPREYKNVAQGAYDDLNKRIVWLYGKPEGSTSPAPYRYNRALVYNLYYKAFTKYNFGITTDMYIGSIFSVKDTPSPDSDKKIKYVTIASSGSVLDMADFTRDDYKDWGITDNPAYLVTNKDTLRNPSSWKYAPWIWVFMNRTENEVVWRGGGYTIKNQGSVKMQARWDWNDLSVGGKWGSVQEVYRLRTNYIPPQPTNDLTQTYDDGNPVVVTRNQVRGRGRCLQVKFSSTEGKAMSLLGWLVQFDQVRG